MLRRLINTLMLVSLSAASALALDSGEIEAAFADRTLDPIEGVWQFPNDGAVFMITRVTATTFDITLLDSPNPSVVQGTIIGQAVVSAKSGVYDTQLDASVLANKRVKKDRATLTITPEGMLAIQTYTTGHKLSWWRWIPYLYRVGVINNDTRPKNLDGARKIYPIDSTNHPPCL